MILKKHLRENLIYIIFILTIFLALSFKIMCSELNNLDELWNYSFAKNISDGLIPYKDFNLVTTPAFAIICGLILKFTSKELIIMRLIDVILCCSTLFVTYKIFNVLNVKKLINAMFMFFISCLILVLNYIDYNFANLFVILLIIYFELKNKKNSFKQDFIIGILAGLSFTIKQNTGLCVCIAVLLLGIINCTDFKFKMKLKTICSRLLGLIIPILTLIMYLMLNNAFLDFIDYAILGLTEFTDNSISYLYLLQQNNFITILAIVEPIAFVILLITILKNKDKNVKNRLCILLAYSLASFVVIYPLADVIHFLIGSFPILISMLYAIYYSVTYTLKKKSINLTSFKNMDKFFIFPIAFFITISIAYIIDVENVSNLNHFKYINVSSSLEERILNINSYITNSSNDVKILDSRAVIFMLPLDIYNKNYDLLFKGNLGKNGQEKIINEISIEEDTIYLVLNDEYAPNRQLATDIVNYVKENKQKIGEIDIFDIYE